MTRLALVLSCVFALAAPALHAQAPAPGITSVLTRLEGTWSGSGTILGQPATVDMQWTPVLDRGFMRLTWVSHIGAAPKTMRFEGHAYYRRAGAGAGAGRATWFDSSGQVRPIVATADGDAIIAAWGTPETEVGETTYRIESATRVLVVDRVRQKDGTWREFGRSTLSRTLPPA